MQSSMQMLRSCRVPTANFAMYSSVCFKKAMVRSIRPNCSCAVGKRCLRIRGSSLFEVCSVHPVPDLSYFAVLFHARLLLLLQDLHNCSVGSAVIVERPRIEVGAEERKLRFGIVSPFQPLFFRRIQSSLDRCLLHCDNMALYLYGGHVPFV